MLRKIIQSACLALGLTAAQHAGAFVLTGSFTDPGYTWQTADLDYGATRSYYTPPQPEAGPDESQLGGPRDIGQGSRLTTPIVTYAYDDTFLTFFGSKGVAAVDSAMQLLNALPSASSANLNNFPTEGNQQYNYTAQALGLLDLKSFVLYLMLGQMGLLGETHTFDLRIRVIISGSTVPCDYEYYVRSFNYDPVTYAESSYVNGRLYSYGIWDGCPTTAFAATSINPSDSSATRFSAVATGNAIQYGGFYQGLTRDDMGGLKYLYAKGNYAYQALDPESVVTTEAGSGLEWLPVETNVVVGAAPVFTGGVLGGVEKITFVKVRYDSLLGTAFTPISYKYTIPFVTNSKLTQLNVTRTVTVPDIIFAAADMIAPVAPVDWPWGSRSGTITPSPYVSVALGGGTEPGTIEPPANVTFDDSGELYFNENFAFMDSLNAETNGFNWGTFDGTTNPPIVYPNSTSLAELEAEVTEGGGASVPTSPWIGVVTTNTTTTGTGGTGIGGAGTP